MGERLALFLCEKYGHYTDRKTGGIQDFVIKLKLKIYVSCQVPENIRDNKFGNWLRDARDWNISRNR